MSPTTTKKAIIKEVEKVPNEKLDELFRHVKGLTRPPAKKISRETFMSKMRKIKIDAPSDFSRNIDLYLSGEKSIE